MKNLKRIRYWGAATSAHQVEGGNRNQWTEWETANAQRLAKEAPDKYSRWLNNWDDIQVQATDPKNYISGKAVDHYNRYEEDFDIAAQLNMNMFRFSVEWSRIEPEKGEWNHREVQRLKHYVKAMKMRNLEPCLNLWHWTVPTWFALEGGFEKRRNNKYFIKFATRLMRELSEDVTYITTLNEPNSYCGMSYLAGVWPPNHRNPLLYWVTMRNLARVHNRLYKELKAIRPGFQIGVAYQFSHFYYTDWLGSISSRFAEYEWNEWWMNKIKWNMDFTGFQYYFSDRFTGFKKNNPNTNVSDYGWDMSPSHIEPLLMEIYQKYKKPILITESGLADAKDKHRKWWIQETLSALNGALGSGVKITGYLHWSLLDNFEWADGFWPKFGLVEVNRKTMKRKVRPSAKFYGREIKKILGQAKKK